MNFKKTTAHPRGHSGVLNEDADDAFELTLYEELVAFTESPDDDQPQAAENVNSLIAQIETGGPPPSDPAFARISSQDPLSVLDRGATEHPGFEALEELAATIKVEPIERLDDSAFQAVPVPQIRNTSDLNRELAELLRGTGPLDPSKARGKNFAPLAACAECGSLSSPDDLFCLACGALLGEADLVVESLTVCTECGATTTADEVFCASCGAVLPE